MKCLGSCVGNHQVWQKKHELTLSCLCSEQFLTQSSQSLLQFLFLWGFAAESQLLLFGYRGPLYTHSPCQGSPNTCSTGLKIQSCLFTGPKHCPLTQELVVGPNSPPLHETTTDPANVTNTHNTSELRALTPLHTHT